LLKELGPMPEGLPMLMDRAYEGNETRQLVLALGMVPVVPPKSNRIDPWRYDRALYKKRNEIERLFRRMKGYRRIYGRAQKDLLDYYVNMGWRAMEGASEFFFSDHAYIEIVIDTEPNPEAVKLGVDPYILMRPEGQWDRPGVLDRSAARGSRRAGGAARK